MRTYWAAGTGAVADMGFFLCIVTYAPEE
jgi:hypothetical protein